jgi:hypothetical protein
MVGRDSVEPIAMQTRMLFGDGPTESRPTGGRNWFEHFFNVAVICLVMGCSPEASHVHEHSDHGGHAHVHVAPHGGAAVVLGEELYHLEFVLDEQGASLDCYVLDGHMEQFLRIAAAEIELELEGGERIKLLPVASRATGETLGDTSHFRAEVSLGEGQRTFEAIVKEISINENRFENIPFRYPEGNEAH